jgi:hypothetical protein
VGSLTDMVLAKKSRQEAHIFEGLGCPDIISRYSCLVKRGFISRSIQSKWLGDRWREETRRSPMADRGDATTAPALKARGFRIFATLD